MEKILWHRLDYPGHEICGLKFHNKQWELSGTALFLYEKNPSKLDYFVTCDSGWRTISAEVKGEIGNRKIYLKISVNNRQQWYLNGHEYPDIEGSIDIDLGFSPSTNLLPIRRLSLTVDEEAQVKAAWLPFPSLEFEPLVQLYRRESENIYRYESGGGRFMRLLEVDATGFVIDYPELWRKEVPA